MAIQTGFEVYSKVNKWFRNVLESLFFKFSKTTSFLLFSRTHNGMLSVTKIELLKTGKIFSSPSEKLPDLAMILYCKPCQPSGILMVQLTAVFSFALQLKFLVFLLFKVSTSIDFPVVASNN